MANTVFKLRRSSVAGKVPNTSTVAIGELAINLTDKKLFSSDGSLVFEIGANLTDLQVSNNITTSNINVTDTALFQNVAVFHDVAIFGAISANSSNGAAGLVLTSNGSGVYWAPAGGSATGPVRQQFTGDGNTTTFAISGGYESNTVSVFLNGVMLHNGLEANVQSGVNVVISPAPANGALIDVVGYSVITSTSYLTIGNTSISGNVISIGNSSVNTQIVPGNVYLNGSTLVIGNTSSNITIDSTTISIAGATINTSSFSGTANNTLYVGSVASNDVVSNTSLQANLTVIRSDIANSYSNSVNYTSFAIGTANLAMVANADAAYSNATSYTDSKIATANSAIVANASAAYSNSVFYTDSKIATANAAIVANASAAYSNSVSYVDTQIAIANSAIVANASSAYSNSVSYVDSKISTANSAIVANASAAYSNSVTYIDSSIGVANAGIVANASAAYSNAVTYIDSSIGVTNAAIVANASAAYSNAISYTDSKIATANTSMVANAAAAYSNSVTYTDTKIATANAAITGNAATAYSNATSYTDSKIATANAAITANASAAYTNATSYSSNASNISSGTVAEARLPYRMNQDVRNTDNVTFGQMTLTGNLVVSGNVNIIGANNLSLVDNMIYLNSNSTVSNPDIGIAGNYNDGTYYHTGFFRDASDGIWKVYDNYAPEPDANVWIDTTNTTFHIANFQANALFLGNTSSFWVVANTSGVHAPAVNTVNVVISGGISANGTYGSAGQSLVSNGTGAYWATAGATLNANNTDSSTYYIGLSSGSSGAWTNAVVSTSKLYFVPSTGTLTVGSATVNSTNYSGTSNNSAYLGGTAAASYLLSSTASSTYLPLSGGTITGTTTVNGDVRIFKNGADSINSHLYFASAGNSQAWNWQLDSSGNAALWGYPNSAAWSKVCYFTPTGNLFASNDISCGSRFHFTAAGAWTGGSYGLIGMNWGGAAGTYKNFAVFDYPNGRAMFTVNGQTRDVEIFGISYAYGSSRSPIFYDSDNTGYYVDPNNTSNLNGLNIGGFPAWKYSTTYTTSTDWNTILPAAYSIRLDEIQNGTGWSNGPSSAYAYGALFSWAAANHALQLYVPHTASGSNNGMWYRTAWVPGTTWNNGYAWARILDSANYSSYCNFGTNNVYGAIYYDGNDTGYYCNPNGISSLWSVNIRGDANSTNYQNQIHFWGSTSTTTSAIGFKSNGGSFTNPTGNGDGYNTYFTMDSDGRGWVFRRGTGGNDFSAAYTSGWILNNGVWQSNASMRSPIFYDSNDTAYYCNPNSLSVLSGIEVGGLGRSSSHCIGSNLSGGIAWNNSQLEIRNTNGGNVGIAFHRAGYTSVPLYHDGGSQLRCGGNLIGDSDIRAPIFYDLNDTAYYVNPNDVSYMVEPRMAWRSLIGNQNYDGCLYDGGYDYRPGITIRGNYPHLNLVSSGINNTSHGPTLRFMAYDTAGATSGNYKHWVIGTSGTNAVRLSIGYASNNANPHEGIYGWGTSAMWFENDSNVYCNSSIRPTIMYDRNDTGYYCDPNSYCSFHRGEFRGYNGSTTSGNAVSLEIENASGTGDGGVAAMSFHCAGHYGMHMHLRNDGYFGIGGWSASAWRWYVNCGNGDMTAAGNVTAYSDPRLKEDIEKIDSALDKIKKLNGVRFKWKDVSLLGRPGEYDYGILANEVEEIAPEIVAESAHDSPDGDKYKTVAYDKLVPFLIEAIKEQQNTIEAMKVEMSDLKKLINS